MGNYSTKTIESNTQKTYGWKPDLPDHRDSILKFNDFKNLSNLPEKIDLREKCPPIYNQGSLGSCTANAIAAAYQFDEILQGEKEIMTPSRLFIYYNETPKPGRIGRESN